jgi:hypothetical protein
MTSASCPFGIRCIVARAQIAGDRSSFHMPLNKAPEESRMAEPPEIRHSLKSKSSLAAL